jgi:hypothetical protein
MVIDAALLLLPFLLPTHPFSHQEEVKRLVDGSVVLMGVVWSNELLVESVMLLLLSVVVFGVDLSSEEKELYFEKMKSNLVLFQLKNGFKRCKFDNARKNICVCVVLLHNGKKIGSEYSEMVSFILGKVEKEEIVKRIKESEELIDKLYYGLFSLSSFGSSPPPFFPFFFFSSL